MRSRSIAAIIAVALLAACKASNDELPPDLGLLRVMHAIPDLGLFTLTFDDNVLGDFNYSQIRGINRPGDGPHQVLVDVKLPQTSDTQRLETLDVTTAVNREDTIVITGTLDDPNVLTFEQPARDWDAEQADSANALTVLEISFANVSETRGPLDFYVGEEGFDPAASAPLVANIGYSELSDGGDIESGLVEVVATPAGDPSTVLLRTIPLALPPATSLLFVAIDSDKLDDSGAPRLAVRSLGNNFENYLIDQDLPSSLRGIHVARGTGPLDFRFGDDEELFASLDFGEVSGYTDVPVDTDTIVITPAGDPDTQTASTLTVLTPGLQQTFVVSGPEDEIVVAGFNDDNRPIVTAARFRMIQSASNFSFVDVYAVDPDESIDDLVPTVASVPYRGSTSYVQLAAGEHDLVFTESGTKNIIDGPLRVTLEDGHIYTAVVLNGEDEDTADVVPADDLVL
jgi:hypothetical protein